MQKEYCLSIKRMFKNGMSKKEIASLYSIDEEEVEKYLNIRKGKPRLDAQLVKDIKNLASGGYSTKEIQKIYRISIDAIQRYTKEERAAYLEKHPKYRLLAPDDTVYKFNKLTEFCKQHHLNYQGITCLLAYERNSHRGWKRVDEENS